MFNSINIGVSDIEFEYILNGTTRVTTVFRSDGVSYSQWSGLWEGLKEFAESGHTTLYDYVERQIDTSEIARLSEAHP